MATPISNATLELRRRQTEGVEVETPSGIIVKIKPIAIKDLLRKGLFPRSLVSAAMSGFPTDGDVQIETEEDVNALLDKEEQSSEVMFHMLSNVLVSPRIVREPSEDQDEIELSMLDPLDQVYLMRIINMPISEWNSFRRELLSDVSDVGISEDVFHTS